MFTRRGKSTEGWALIGFGVLAFLFSVIALSGGFGPIPDGGRAGTLAYLGIPVGIAAIVVGIVGLRRDDRRAGD
ncbi:MULTISPECIES: hypothetical protein [unclassified Frigoribacterium]|jgi:hypothetical protein|uniref:hypothetical protein n=1 Tax=unclassified Frigoribacterium TaxID=2627005 RepID=UPI0006FB0B0A|nr:MULTISPECIES: hypothetical protein [unclassified Frigoribacterium]KQN45120.1 hypothetical protein ASE87_00180 [Frigoribacterium sp. Leaf44]MBD8539616.1 hypothetical protein [Frigoribacterium sp. CFBP 8751]